MDNHFPTALGRFLEKHGHEVEHVRQLGMDESLDSETRERATAARQTVISKDEDFLHLAHRPGDRGKLLWVRIGNCRRAFLLEAFERALPQINREFAEGARVVELR